MEINLQELKNEELVEVVGKSVIGTPSGLKAQHAQAELTKRLMDSINRLNEETGVYSNKVIDLTIILFLVSIMQLFVAFKSISASMKGWTALVIISSAFLFWVIKDISNKRKI